jgi:2-hydroxy-3-oxopropionate reductase
LNNAVQLANELGVEIPMSKMVLEYMNELETDGRINEDHCAVARIY